MKPLATAPNEYLDADKLTKEEQLFLTGIIYGVKVAMPSRVGMAYIEDLENNCILWASCSCIRLDLDKKICPPIKVEDLHLYSDNAELKRVSELDLKTLEFIEHQDLSSSQGYSIRYNTSIQRKEHSIIYEKRTRYLIPPGGVHIRFRVCCFQVSAHSKWGEVRIARDGDEHYYKLASRVPVWVKRESLRLTSREQLILVLSCKGMSEREIANYLYISLPRLKSVKSELFKRLHVNSITQAIRRAYSYGLLV